ncbi:hypothetical protein CBM2609_A170033 [Cupriavidus taiwanensis]|nr:hypothetical protein CBM2604_A140034 [Cupriavidus taiwanensis]SOZ25739.1 hypothetical protein CBM2609_A170033 [Cupriavidus taiwanensis]SOZ44980.1 hypothetical protein CBM2610_A160033 [Cupriavidus taiwanensis]
MAAVAEQARHQAQQRLAVLALGVVERVRGAVQELARERAGERLEHGLRIVAACQHAARAFQFGLADGFAAALQLTDDRHHAAGFQPVHEVLHTAFDDGFGLGHRGLAQGVAFAHDGAEVVDGIEEDVVQARDFGLDVARHGQVDHHDGAVLAPLDRALDRSQADDRQRAGGARHHDVELMQALAQVRQADRVGGQALAAELLGQLLAALHSAVGHHDLARLLRGKVGGAQFDHLARANKQHALGRDAFEDPLRQPHRGRGHRHRMRADLGLAAHFLGHREGPLEQLVQVRAERAGFAGGAHRVLELAQDLGLAQHHRIEPAGHAEGVPHGFGLRQRVQVRRQLRGRHVVMLRQPAQGVLEAIRARRQHVGGTVDFGAVAGGQDGGFGAAAPRQVGAQRAQRRLDLLERKRHPLAQRDGCRSVIDADREQLHCWGLVQSGARPDWMPLYRRDRSLQSPGAVGGRAVGLQYRYAAAGRGCDADNTGEADAGHLDRGFAGRTGGTPAAPGRARGDPAGRAGAGRGGRGGGLLQRPRAALVCRRAAQQLACRDRRGGAAGRVLGHGAAARTVNTEPTFRSGICTRLDPGQTAAGAWRQARAASSRRSTPLE